MDRNKSLLPPLLLIFFLCSSSFLSVTFAVPSSRSLKAIKEDHVVRDLQAKDAGTLESQWQTVEGKGRMLIESNDYDGAGANPHHDPRTPGSR